MVILLSLENHPLLDPSFGNPAVRPRDLTRRGASRIATGLPLSGRRSPVLLLQKAARPVPPVQTDQ